MAVPGFSRPPRRSGGRTHESLVSAPRIAAVLTLLGALALGPARPACAQAAPDRVVYQHRDRGIAAYGRGQYAEAVAEFRRAYEVEADPAFLFDIARAYAALDEHERALFFYRRYLAARPDADDRDAVEERIRLLAARVHAADPTAAPGALPAAPAPAGARAARADLVQATPPDRPPPSRPLWRRWWVWTGVGGAVAMGIATAVLVSGSSKDARDGTELGKARFF